MADFSKYYRAYMYMQDLLKTDFTYNYILEGLKDGDRGDDTLVGKTNEKVIDLEWVEAIEEALPYMQKAIDEHKRFIKQIENVVRIELARKTGPESVKHLSMHTNFIAKVEGDMVTPNKILITEHEDSFAIYENRFLMTLIRRTLAFVADKYSKMKDVPDDSFNDFAMNRTLRLHEEKSKFNFKYSREAHETLADDLDLLDVNELSDFDRIRRIRNTLNSFLASDLMIAIAKESEVRPPITQTNMLKKNPNFKKAMELWSFLDKYQKPGFEIVGESFDGAMSEQVQEDVYFTMGFEHFMMSIATNPGLRRMLQQKYDEENARIAEEEAQPQRTREAVLKAQLEAVRKEEMQIRLAEIRDREKKIADLTQEVKNLKVTLEQKEQQILELKGKVSALQDEVAALREELQQTKVKLLEAQKRIKELEEENEQLKAKIAELEAHIQELNLQIEMLNKEIEELNQKIEALEAENAQLKAKIAEQEEIIASQKARIEDLEAQVAAHLATIAALQDNIAKCEAQIAEDERQITDLTNKNETLTQTLQNERIQAREREEKMTADFEEKTRLAAEKHSAEVRSMQKTIDDAEASHKDAVAKMNEDFAKKTSLAEEKRVKDLSDQQKEFEAQITKIKKSNDDAAAAVDAKHAAEIAKVQKSVDKRVEEARKAAEKSYESKVKDIQKKANEDVKKAEKKAGEKASLAKEEVRAVKKSADAISRDYAFGSVKLISEYAEILAKRGEAHVSVPLGTAAKNIRSLSVTKSRKGVVLSECTSSGVSVVKLYKKAASLDVALADIPAQLKGVSNDIASVTFCGVDKDFANKYAQQVKSAGVSEVTVSQNKSLKSDGMVAIYFCKG